MIIINGPAGMIRYYSTFESDTTIVLSSCNTDSTGIIYGTTSYHNRRYQEDLFNEIDRSLRRLHKATRKFAEKVRQARERSYQALRELRRLQLHQLRRGFSSTSLLGPHPQRYDDAYVRPLFKPRVCSLSGAYRGRVPTVP